MAEIGELSVRMDTNNRQLQAGLRHAGRSVTGFERRATRATKRVAAGFVAVRTAINSTALAATGLIGVVAVGFFAKASRDAIQFADSIAKTADSIGITTETLQELRFVASQTGVTTQALEKAYKKLAQGIGEARKGSGLLITALRDTDPELLQTLLHAEGTEDAFLKMLKAIRNTADGIDKIGLAAAAFGARGGVALINMARLTDVQFQELIITARETGQVLGDEMLRESERLNDEFDKLSRTIGANLKRAFIGLAPAVNRVTQLLADNLEAFALLRARGEEDVTKIPRRVLDVLGVEAATRVSALQSLIDDPQSRQVGGRRVSPEAVRKRAVEDLVGALQRQADIEGEIKRLDADRAARAKIEKVITEDRLAEVEAENAANAIAKEHAASLRILTAEQDAFTLAVALAEGPLIGETVAIDQQIAKLAELAVAEKDEIIRTRILNRLRERQAEIRGNLVKATELAARNLALPQTTTSGIVFGEPLAGLDSPAARAAEAAQDQQIIDEEQAAAELKQFGDNMASTITRGVGSGLADAFSGEGIEFAELFADAGSGLFEASMNEALNKLQGKISDLFQGAGEGLGSALGIGLGIGASLLAGALKDTESNITRSNVASAITSSQELRGVVAGPTNIAIAQVAPAIDDAFEESRVIARRGNFLLGEILSAVSRTFSAGGGAPSFDLAASQSLG